jgi:hypothetical protein
MRNFLQLQQFRPGDSRIDTAPVQNALEAYGNKTMQFNQIERQNEAQQYQRGRDTRQDARQDETFKQQNLERLGKSAFAYSQLPPEQRDPRTWGRMVEAMKRFDSSIGSEPDDLDPIAGPAKFAAVYGGQVQDPMDAKIKQADLAYKQAMTAKAQRGDAPEYKEVDGRLIQLGADGPKVVYEAPNAGRTKLDDALQKEQFKIDLKTSNEYRQASDNAGDVLGSLDELQAARDETTREGPILGMLPNVSGPAQRVESTAENVRLGFVQKTKGAVSDAEMRVFGQATPNMSMRDDAAAPIITGMRLANQRVQERANFFDAWMRSRGSLEGAQDAWKRFTDEKPIIARDPKTNKFVPQPQNVSSWKPYFDGSAAARQPVQTQQAAPTGKRFDFGDGFEVEVND